jgi:Sulfotransferase family
MKVQDTKDASSNILLLGHVHYSNRYRYLYVDTPKVASSTIKYTLHCAELGKQAITRNVVPARYGYSRFLLDIHDQRKSPLRWPGDAHELQQFLRTSRFTFCFVRNPFSRVLSAYLDKIIGNVERRNLFLDKLDGAGAHRHRDVSFVEFLELIHRQAPEVMDPHWRPQHLHLHGVMAYDFMGSFERFQDDFRAVLTAIDPTFPKRAATVDEHGSRASSAGRILQYYADKRAVQLVSEIYAQDFALFGYSMVTDLVTNPPRVSMM